MYGYNTPGIFFFFFFFPFHNHQHYHHLFLPLFAESSHTHLLAGYLFSFLHMYIILCAQGWSRYNCQTTHALRFTNCQNIYTTITNNKLLKGGLSPCGDHTPSYTTISNNKLLKGAFKYMAMELYGHTQLLK